MVLENTPPSSDSVTASNSKPIRSGRETIIVGDCQIATGYANSPPIRDCYAYAEHRYAPSFLSVTLHVRGTVSNALVNANALRFTFMRDTGQENGKWGFCLERSSAEVARVLERSDIPSRAASSEVFPEWAMRRSTEKSETGSNGFWAPRKESLVSAHEGHLNF